MKGSNSLLPIYNQIMTYQRDANGDDRDEDEIVKNLLQEFGGNKHKYLRFVLFPDVYPPCRPPSIFPYPTHMYRDLGSTSLTATGGALYLAWTPLIRSTNGINSVLTTWHGSNTVTVGANKDILNTITGEVDNHHPAPTVSGIEWSHARGLAAYLQVTYIGRADELSGTIEIGVAIEDYVAPNSSSATKYIPTQKLKGLYQYKRMNIAEGVRCVWLPLSEASFDSLSNHLNSPPALNQTYHIHLTGVSASPNVFRVDWGYYYDAPVNEEGFNTLLPKRPERDPSTLSAIVKTANDMSEIAAVTPAHPQDGFMKNLWHTVKQEFSNNVGPLINMGVREGFSLLKNPAMFLK